MSQRHIAELLVRKRNERGVELVGEMQFLAWGRPVTDVAEAATTILMSCIVAYCKDREHAVKFAQLTGEKMAEAIERDYEHMREDVANDPKAN